MSLSLYAIFSSTLEKSKEIELDITRTADDCSERLPSFRVLPNQHAGERVS